MMTKQNKKGMVVAVSGYFNPLHIGHVRYLQAAKRLGTKLVVIINSDAQVKLKGGNLFMNEKERADIVSALKPVNQVILAIDKDRSVCKTLELLKPDIFANGGDRTNDNIPEIFAWPDGLKQVFMNLLVNSIDAMHNGGEIIIGLKKTEHTVIFSFEDGGQGIEAEHIPHIFDPYYTTKSSSGGSGLGLSVCYNIIKNHNGSINYTNTKRGGCFIIELPIEQGDNDYDWQI